MPITEIVLKSNVAFVRRLLRNSLYVFRETTEMMRERIPLSFFMAHISGKTKRDKFRLLRMNLFSFERFDFNPNFAVCRIRFK